VPNTLRQTAVAALSAVLVTTLAPAAATRADAPVETRAVEIVASVDGSRTFSLSMPASHVAVHWPGAADARLSVAFSSDGVSFGADEPVEIDEVGASRRDGRTYGALMVAAGATAVRITSDRPLPQVELLVLDTRRDEAGAWGLGTTTAAAVAQPWVIPRAGWGADESLRFDEAGEEIWPREYFRIQKLVVHHTAMGDDDPDPAATVRAIYYYHAVTQEWGDIGYNFLVDSAGRVYEGRYSREYSPDAVRSGDDGMGRGVVAGHAREYNSGTFGIAILGTYDQRAPTPAARDALVGMLAWASIRYGLNPLGSGTYINPVTGITIDTDTIAGHREYNPTACPGAVLNAMLPDIRNRVANLMLAQTFGDIGASAFIGDIAWLYSQAITNGCAPGLFCPGLTVTRAEMASFLARALVLPPAATDHFWDDEGPVHQDAINRVADAGITLGCGQGRYCPNDPVTRAEMASFLTRALKLPPSTVDHFWDDNGSIHEADINRVADARITLGCGPGEYCPSATTTREQMAAFLHRALTR
jgi:hypothetical protein